MRGLWRNAFANHLATAGERNNGRGMVWRILSGQVLALDRSFEGWNNRKTLARLAQANSSGRRLLEIGVGSGSS